MGESAMETAVSDAVSRIRDAAPRVDDAVSRLRDAAPSVDDAVSRIRDAAPSVDLSAGKDAVRKATSGTSNRAVLAVAAMGATLAAVLWWLRQR